MVPRPLFVSFLAVIAAICTVFMLLIALPAVVVPGEFKIDIANQNEWFESLSFAIQLRRWTIAALAGYFAFGFGVAARGLWQMRKYGAVWATGICLVVLIFSIMLLTPLEGSAAASALTISVWCLCAFTIVYLVRLWKLMA